MNKRIMRKEKGITLIALIVTIVILIILAGISINLLIGEDGLIGRAKKGSDTYSEQQAKEKLELVLVDMQVDKIDNKEYNQNEYLTSKIEENEMTVNGDIVFVNGWQFEIDRSVPKISASLGQGEANEQIKIIASQEVSSDYVKSTIKVEIEYKGEITYIQIAGEEITVPEKQDGKYIVEKEVTANGSYSVLVKDTEEKYQIANIKVSDITEDMEIWNRADMESFRDKVNSGRTYEGRTVRLMSDIDLEGSESNQWIPIGVYQTDNKKEFKGNFIGNYHTINHIYINTNLSHQALFAFNCGKIEGIQIKESKIESDNDFIGGICAINYGEISNCSNYANVTGKKGVAGIAAFLDKNGTVKNCYNVGNIYAKNHYAAGISSTLYSMTCVVENCYNVGSMSATIDYASGIVSAMEGEGGIVRNCYNINNNIVASTKGAIMAYLRFGKVEKSYWLEGIIPYTHCVDGATFQGEEMTETEMKSNDFVKKLGEDNWVIVEGMNNGYPVLKWQVE